MFLRFSEQAATFPLYIINTLVFATQTDCANSIVGTETLNEIRIILRLKRKKISSIRYLDILV
jgi:hypothetical protein